MLVDRKKLLLALAVLILLGGLIPIFNYWYLIGRVPAVTPRQARELLSATGAKAVLIDVSSPQQFDDRHLKGAQNWPYNEIMALSRTAAIPDVFKGKTLLLVSDDGISSARAVQRLRGWSGVEAFNIDGGMQAWIASANGPNDSAVLLESASGEILPSPFKESPWYEQLALVGAAFIIKPIYTLIAIVLIALLWRLKSPDLVALRWGLIFFLIGEMFCAVNIAQFRNSFTLAFHLFEFFHMYGMVLSLGFVTYALLEGLDSRVINYSDPKKRCVVLGLCRQCVKYGKVQCAIKRLFYFLIPTLIILAFVPLLVDTHATSYNTSVLNIFYNYSHPVIYQTFEFRYVPAYAIVLLAASLLILLFTERRGLALQKILFATGAGSLAFAFLMLVFAGLYRDNLVWYNFWEEMTELMYMAGVAIVLWVFRRGLFPAAKNLDQGEATGDKI